MSARSAGDDLRAALLEPDAAARADALAGMGAEGARFAPLVEIARAGALAEANDLEAASEVLATLSVNPETPEIYRSLALLQRLTMLGSDIDTSERLATLQGLTAPGAPFRPLALEQRALVHLENGDAPAALSDLEAVLAEPGVPEALRTRAQQLIIASGGALPVDGTPAASAPADG